MHQTFLTLILFSIFTFHSKKTANMSAVYSPFLTKKMPYDCTQEEKLKLLSDFARAGVCIPSFNELLDDSTMVVVKDGVMAATDEILYEFKKPTEAVLKAGQTGGAAPYSQFALLDGFHILVPDEGIEKANFNLTVNNGEDSYEWEVSVTSYTRCINYLKYQMEELSDDSDEFWEEYDRESFRAFNYKLIQQLELCRDARVIFVL